MYMPCPRCLNGQMGLDNVENEDFCLQCGYRRPARPLGPMSRVVVGAQGGAADIEAECARQEVEVGQALG